MKKMEKPKGMFTCIGEHHTDGSNLVLKNEIWVCPECGKSTRMICSFSEKEIDQLPARAVIT